MPIFFWDRLSLNTRTQTALTFADRVIHAWKKKHQDLFCERPQLIRTYSYIYGVKRTQTEQAFGARFFLCGGSTPAKKRHPVSGCPVSQSTLTFTSYAWHIFLERIVIPVQGMTWVWYPVPWYSIVQSTRRVDAEYESNVFNSCCGEECY